MATLTATAISPTTAQMPGPKNQELEEILGRYPLGTKARLKKLLGEKPDKGAQAEFIRQAMEAALKRRERQKAP